MPARPCPPDVCATKRPMVGAWTRRKTSAGGKVDIIGRGSVSGRASLVGRNPPQEPAGRPIARRQSALPRLTRPQARPTFSRPKTVRRSKSARQPPRSNGPDATARGVGTCRSFWIRRCPPSSIAAATIRCIGKPTRERRQFTNSHDELSQPARELAQAIDGYKLRHRRRFITFEEMLSVIQSLGYRKDEDG